ncbi:MAG: prolyl oligopeptidase family serine peptidase [Polyangiaceae bacterium]
MKNLVQVTLVSLAVVAPLALFGAAGCPSSSTPLGTPTGIASTSASTAPEPHPVNVHKVLPYPDNHPGTDADEIFGKKVPDPYRWLEDLKNPEVGKWIDAQDKLARGELAKLPERDAIAARLKELMYVDSLSAPRHRGNRYFYTRRLATKEKSIAYYKDGKDGKETILFDPNTWSADGSISLGSWSVSQDGKKVAYTTHQNNSDEATLKVLDIDTKKESDVIEGAKYAYASWNKTSDGFVYTWLPVDKSIPDSDRPGYAEVRYHKLGADPAKDEVLKEKTGDPTRFLSAGISEDGTYMILDVSQGWSGNEIYFMDLSKKDRKWTPLVTGFKAHYGVSVYKGAFYVSTDENAPKWRVLKADPKSPDRSKWTELIKESDATLDGFNIIGGRLALTYLSKATSQLEIHDLDGTLFKKLDGLGLGTIGGPSGREDEDEAYFSFESYTTPSEIRSLSMKTGETKIYSQVNVKIDRDRFVVEQVTYPSKDGTPVTMFIVHDKNLVKNGENRTLLYGYGGFQATETPAFSSTIFPWLERGGVYAVANLRGGAEYGEQWHQDGMLLKKQNVFDDFIAAGEYLVREKYTSSSHLAISGASNGGLLVGAAMVQRPDLFSAVLCGVPLLDMVRYEKFGSGKTWVSEYGSVSDEAQFNALFAYSPYHHVQKGVRYPALLMLAADHDDRVDPMHARKFTAFVQDSSDGSPAIMRVEKNSGHGGADMRKAEVEKGADRYAFALYYTSGTPKQ